MSDSRAKKSGLAAEIEAKVEQRYQEAEEQGTVEAVRLWLNAIVGSDHENIASSEYKTIHRALADGIFLCKVLNKLLSSEGKKAVSFQKKVASPFIAMGNSESFNKGIVSYGVEQSAQFQGVDLWEGKKAQFLNVVNCLHKLGMVANKKGFSVTYTGKAEVFVSDD